MHHRPYYRKPLPKPSRLSTKAYVLLTVGVIAAAILIPLLFTGTPAKPGTPKKQEGSDIRIASPHSISVYLAKEGRTVEMDLEEYVLGVTAAEMPASFELEALKAQAVSARTYAVHRIEKGSTEPAGAQICTSSGHCQAYVDEAGMKKNWGADFEARYAKLKKAVYETQGKIIVYGGQPIEVMYHSTSGGYTEDSEHVFSAARPYLRGVQSEGEEDAPKFYGQVSVSAKSFAAKLKTVSSAVKVNTSDVAKSIGTVKRYESGRVETAHLGGVLFTGREIRGLFSLNSTNFTITVKNNEVVFDTVGFGHGVGLSQLGANAMAKKGADYIEILQHYFTGVQIVEQ